MPSSTIVHSCPRCATDVPRDTHTQFLVAPIRCRAAAALNKYTLGAEPSSSVHPALYKRWRWASCLINQSPLEV
ncbi:hypothetical protein POSPLADRAFT_1182190 [Postia placenta MAD-698-R-SB12]|uniref:Uncharacterized protein n=1 Tax=Postia placenta MAD-698-R-SB12 TaxID=670580 RepID=A0A1X6MXF0_9APHY|nr:hypothetical protein POSPLADRAFT_1182190 [Postia placenta MAD-698-R-SB12]OSX61019.1 hypothetical protein POSPLADRAFT_1182190 [Postia placenta MAD-698-R-SB12]